MTDTPTPPRPTGDSWIPDGWDIPPNRPVGRQRRPSFADRVAQVQHAMHDAVERLIDWAEPRWERVQESLDDRAELARRCGRHPADIPTRHGNEPLHRMAADTLAPVRWTRTAVSTVGMLASVLLIPAVAAWRPYRQLQEALGRRMPSWARVGGHPHTTGQHVVHWLATTPAVAIVIALLAIASAAARVEVIAMDAAHGYARWFDRIQLGLASVALTIGVWHPTQQAARHIAGIQAAAIAPVALALVLGAALTAFHIATGREAAAVRRLNRFTALADIAAEEREAAAA